VGILCNIAEAEFRRPNRCFCFRCSVIC